MGRNYFSFSFLLAFVGRFVLFLRSYFLRRRCEPVGRVSPVFYVSLASDVTALCLFFTPYTAVLQKATDEYTKRDFQESLGSAEIALELLVLRVRGELKSAVL